MHCLHGELPVKPARVSSACVWSGAETGTHVPWLSFIKSGTDGKPGIRCALKENRSVPPVP